MPSEAGICFGNSASVSDQLFLLISVLHSLYLLFRNLQKTLSELQSYQVRLKNFQTLHEEMLRHVVDSETRQLSALTYDHVAYGPLEGRMVIIVAYLTTN